MSEPKVVLDKISTGTLLTLANSCGEIGCDSIEEFLGDTLTQPLEVLAQRPGTPAQVLVCQFVHLMRTHHPHVVEGLTNARQNIDHLLAVVNKMEDLQ